MFIGANSRGSVRPSAPKGARNLLLQFSCRPSQEYIFFHFSFLQQKKATDSNEDGSSLYVVPVKPKKPAAQKTESPTHDTPRKQEKPDSQEPQVVEASGFFNPLYQTRAQVQQFPDISSIFAAPSPPPEKELDDAPGESDC